MARLIVAVFCRWAAAMRWRRRLPRVQRVQTTCVLSLVLPTPPWWTPLHRCVVPWHVSPTCQRAYFSPKTLWWREGGYFIPSVCLLFCLSVCLSVCPSVSKITETVMNEILWKFWKGRHWEKQLIRFWADLHLSFSFSFFSFGVAHAPFACQRWGLPHRLAQWATPGKGLVQCCTPLG